MATDEHTWQLFVEDQGLELENYPCTETVVEFAVSAERFRTMCDVCVMSAFRAVLHVRLAEQYG